MLSYIITAKPRWKHEPKPINIGPLETKNRSIAYSSHQYWSFINMAWIMRCMPREGIGQYQHVQQAAVTPLHPLLCLYKHAPDEQWPRAQWHAGDKETLGRFRLPGETTLVCTSPRAQFWARSTLHIDKQIDHLSSIINAPSEHSSQRALPSIRQHLLSPTPKTWLTLDVSIIWMFQTDNRQSGTAPRHIIFMFLHNSF